LSIRCNRIVEICDCMRMRLISLEEIIPMLTTKFGLRCSFRSIKSFK
jgi:hypothetical protein